MAPTILPNQNTNPEYLRSIQELPTELQHFITEDIWLSLTYEQKEILANLDNMPNSLMEVMSIEAWSTLSVKQRLEVLMSYEIIPKVSLEGQMVNQSEQQLYEPTANIEEIGAIGINEVGSDAVETKVSIDIEDPAKKEFDEIKKRIQTIESSAEAETVETIQNNVPNPVENIPTQVVQSSTFNMHSVRKFTGVQPSDDIFTNYENYIDGDEDLGRTWVANIVQKLTLALQNPDE